MAIRVTNRPIDISDKPHLRVLASNFYGEDISADILSDEGVVVELDGRLAAFTFLYRQDGLKIAAVDWTVLCPLHDVDRRDTLSSLLDGLRKLKEKHELNIIAIHTPYPEFRELLNESGLHPGEEGIKRLFA